MTADPVLSALPGVTLHSASWGHIALLCFLPHLSLASLVLDPEMQQPGCLGLPLHTPAPDKSSPPPGSEHRLPTGLLPDAAPHLNYGTLHVDILLCSRHIQTEPFSIPADPKPNKNSSNSYNSSLTSGVPSEFVTSDDPHPAAHGPNQTTALPTGQIRPPPCSWLFLPPGLSLRSQPISPAAACDACKTGLGVPPPFNRPHGSLAHKHTAGSLS